MLATAIAVGIHVLCAVVWIGGMFFVHTALRPVMTDLLELPLQVKCWEQIFSRFFKLVWIAIILLLSSGAWLINTYGGMAKVGISVHLMVGLGIFMTILFGHIFFAPYRRFKQAVANADFPEASRRLKQIRGVMTVNLGLGLLITVIAASGSYLQALNL